MPPTAEDRLRDILEAIAEIDKMLAGCRLEQFAADKMRRMATERLSRSHLRTGTKAS
jgi:uncharacterized protein with HEPN domain